MAKHATNSTENTLENDIIPDFCHNQVILLVILIAELLAIVLTLNQAHSGHDWLSYLAYSSLFIQCVALIDAIFLCNAKCWLQRLQPLHCGILIYVVLQIVTACVTLLSYFILHTNQIDAVFAGDLMASLIRNIGSSAIITAVAMRYFYIRHQNRQRLQTENLARIQALQARIRPHFLFNSLNTIANLIHAKPVQAEDAVLDLAELFRSTLADQTQITLAEELNVTKRYLNMELLRLGDRLRVDWDIPAALHTLELPALVLQPLIENAIYHGIEPLTNGGVIEIKAWEETNLTIISVSNPVIDNYAARRTQGNQIALNNIQQRLKLAYKNAATLDAQQDKHTYTVILKIPKDKKL